MNDDTRGLVPLSRLPDLRVADGYTDIRGFAVLQEDGRRIGTVTELLADPGARRVASVLLAVDRALLPAGEAEAEVAIESVEIDTPGQRVFVPASALGHLGLGASPPPVPDEDVTQILPSSDEQRMTLSEEELALRKRQVPAGEVDVVKRVETEQVQESMPVAREEVSVEHRPVAGGGATSERMAAQPSVEGDEIRIPIVEEELVMEKRPVVREELVIHKDQVVREQVVEADLRRERAEVHDRRDDRAGDDPGRNP